MTDQLKQAQSHAAEGMQALHAGNGPKAKSEFQSAIDLGWSGVDVWVMLSHAYLLCGDKPARLQALEQASRLDPGNLRAAFYRAEALVDSGRTAEAHQAFESALRSSAGLQMNEELSTLASRARRFLEAQEVGLDLRPRFEGDQLGQSEDDAEFEQSLAILTGQKSLFLPSPTKYLYPGLPSRQFYPREGFDWVSQLERQTETITGELLSLLQADAGRFQPYVEGAGREGTSVSHRLLNNPDWSAFYLIKQGVRQEENIARCPITMNAIEAIEDANPDPAPSVLFSLLKPGASIPPHHGMLNTRLICHLPLIVPEDCGFRVGNETRSWTPGTTLIFDDTIEHEAWNRSSEARYVLIFELWRPELKPRQRNLVSKLFRELGAR